MEACTCYAIFLSTLIFLYEHVFHFSAWFRMTTQHHGGGVLRVWGGGVSEPKVSCWFVLCVCVCVYVRALSLSRRPVLGRRKRTSCCILTQLLSHCDAVGGATPLLRISRAFW